MNKAFVREPDFEAAVCPQCGGLGAAVKTGPLDTHVAADVRNRFGDTASFCENSRCTVIYFDDFEATVTVDELRDAVFPHDPAAPICPCFGFRLEQIEADVNDGSPTRIRELLAQTQSSEARCETLAVDGRCCKKHIQRLYMQMMQMKG
ncbi:MAG: hypothetical protein QGG36_11440 [Pirellulaceae bacterium]|jgi:hypothetical protein|nr:hypothetical protein [Pirellulaceae bacterium]MDP7016408.1 hypothetical protein [Pirellulaceae bacterium]